mmetsp:Transcript_79432/g.246369  ORF Transcript_79432/g.246369 Transcript_79432/m.246369 type:complete len:412 (-) Transcript_79432:125-1360(-)
MAPGAREITGLSFVVVGVQFSVLANTMVKLLAGMPMLQLMQARFLLQWLVSMSICLVLRCRGTPIHLFGTPGCRLRLVARAGGFSGALGCLWCALRTLPVGEATAITYLNPVVCGLLAMYFLNERLGWRFSVQAAVSCVGVLLVVNPSLLAGEPVHLQHVMDHPGHPAAVHATQPGGGTLHAAALAALGCVLFATGNMLVRTLQGVHPLEVQVFQDTVTALVMIPAATVATGAHMDFGSWDANQVPLLVAFTACGLAASFFIIMGYSLAPASKAALFMYVEVPSAFAVQVAFFGQIPSPAGLCGAVLIVAAAACRLWHEVSVGSTMASPPPSPMAVPFATTPLPSPFPSPFSPISPMKLPLLAEDACSLDGYGRECTPGGGADGNTTSAGSGEASDGASSDGLPTGAERAV